MIRVVFALFAIFSLAACADEQATMSEAPRETPTLENCERLGGYVQRVGLMGEQACVIEYKDKGKACTDGSQCEGECWATPQQYPPGTKVTGTCQPTNMPFGCNARVTNGVVSPVLCVD